MLTKTTNFQFGSFRSPEKHDSGLMDGRSFDTSAYRFGFGGQEKDEDINSNGNVYTAQYWEYDSRLGRRWNVDPLINNYPQNSSYSCFNNIPTFLIDENGLEPGPTKINGADRKISKYRRKENKLQRQLGGNLNQQALDLAMQNRYGRRNWMYARSKHKNNTKDNQSENGLYDWYSVRELSAFDFALNNPVFQNVVNPIGRIPDIQSTIFSSIQANCLGPNCSEPITVNYGNNNANNVNGIVFTSFSINVISAANNINNNVITINPIMPININMPMFNINTLPQLGIAPSFNATYTLNPNLSIVNGGVAGAAWTAGIITITRQVRVLNAVQVLPAVNTWSHAGAKRLNSRV